MAQNRRRITHAASVALWTFITLLLAGNLACSSESTESQEEEVNIPAAFNPAPPIRRAFIVKLQVLDRQIQGYRAMQGTYPVGEGIAVLHAAGITSAPSSDPWNNAVIYKGESDRYEFASAGPDRAWKTKDDIKIVNGKQE